LRKQSGLFLATCTCTCTCTSTNETSKEGVQTVSDREAPLHVGVVRVAEQGRGLEGREGFESFASGDREGAALVGGADAPGAFGDVEHGALRRAESLVAKLGVADPRGLDGQQKLDGNLVSDETVMSELRRSALVGHALHRAGIVTPRLCGGAIRARLGMTDRRRPTSAKAVSGTDLRLHLRPAPAPAPAPAPPPCTCTCTCFPLLLLQVPVPVPVQVQGEVQEVAWAALRYRRAEAERSRGAFSLLEVCA
jgi:hypothetical protein